VKDHPKKSTETDSIVNREMEELEHTVESPFNDFIFSFFVLSKHPGHDD